MGLHAHVDLEKAEVLKHPFQLLPSERRKLARELLMRPGGMAKFRDLRAAEKGPGLLSFDEAAYYGLIDRSIDRNELVRYCGRRGQKLFHTHCNNRNWLAASHDKALYYTVMRGANLPVPETLAISGAKYRHGFPRHLKDAEAVKAFLLSNETWPLFMKPIDGRFSLGTIKVLARNGEILSVQGQSEISIDALIDYMEGMSKRGYLFQRCLSPSTFAANHFGPIIPTLRLFVLFSETRPTVESALIKIPSGDDIADNYWRAGNMLGSLDKETGKIRRVVTGTASSLREVESHPKTGKTFGGLKIQDFEEACRLALQAASVFFAVRNQSWDVALSDSGPVLMEFNFGGDLNLHQLAHGRGILSDSFISHLKRCGYSGQLP